MRLFSIASKTKSLLASAVLFGGTALFCAPQASAEMTISGYGGASFSPHSGVDYNIPGLGTGRVTPKWDGASFEMPPYYGVRATWWLDSMPEFGIALDFTHAKAKADPIPAPFTVLEFTDGMNYLTLNAMYRREFMPNWTSYAGVGVGLAIPHVELNAPGITPTREYQVTGVAAQALIGVDYRLTDNWSVFGELKSGYGQIDADLNGGGNIDTHIISNQIILGVTYKLF